MTPKRVEMGGWIRYLRHPPDLQVPRGTLRRTRHVSPLASQKEMAEIQNSKFKIQNSECYPWPMETVTRVLATTSEISLKGGNRMWFERKLTDNVNKALSGLPVTTVDRPAWRVLIEFSEPVPFVEVARRLGTVFGVGAVMAGRTRRTDPRFAAGPARREAPGPRSRELCRPMHEVEQALSDEITRDRANGGDLRAGQEGLAGQPLLTGSDAAHPGRRERAFYLDPTRSRARGASGRRRWPCNLHDLGRHRLPGSRLADHEAWSASGFRPFPLGAADRSREPRKSRGPA